MKTAMQELMDALNDLEAVYIQNDWRREVIGINQAKNLIEYIYLEKEKEQIKGSWNHGFDWGMMEQSLAEQGAESTLIDAEHYYNETFNTNER
jgi:hypothetical protein